MRRLRQFVRPTFRHVAVLLACAGQFMATVGLCVRIPPVTSPSPSPVIVAAPFKKCCCNPDSNEPCRCAGCAGDERAPTADPEPASEWHLILSSGHCQGTGPLLTETLPPCLPCVAAAERYIAEPAGWLAENSANPVESILPPRTPPPRHG